MEAHFTAKQRERRKHEKETHSRRHYPPGGTEQENHQSQILHRLWWKRRSNLQFHRARDEIDAAENSKLKILHVLYFKRTPIRLLTPFVLAAKLDEAEPPLRLATLLVEGRVDIHLHITVGELPGGCSRSRF